MDLLERIFCSVEVSLSVDIVGVEEHAESKKRIAQNIIQRIEIL